MSEEAIEPPLMQADETMSPVDLPGEEEDAHPLRWASIVIGGGALFLGLTNATTIDGWARELPPGPYAGRAAAATGRWLALTDGLGLGAPRAALHAVWKKAEAGKFQ